MPSLSCCTVMKRKSNGVGVMEEEEREEKRSRVEENGRKTEGEEEVAKVAAKCPICLWPAGAPQCYHTPQTGL